MGLTDSIRFFKDAFSFLVGLLQVAELPAQGTYFSCDHLSQFLQVAHETNPSRLIG